jgi:DNA-3-methyladenine glycosylase II
MFLMFALRRPDVLANDDYGIRQAAGKVFGLGRPATTAELSGAAESWRPHRSAALFYLWAASDGGLMACGE